MARKRDTSSSKERAPRKGMRPGTGAIRRRGCWFCKEGIEEIDYKNGAHLRRYVSEKGKIRSRRVTGACRKHQRQLAVAIKRAREMALLPYSTG
jgi:small subunit ribosomal protein S18